MEDSITLVLVLGLIVGGLTLILAAAYSSAEKTRARTQQARQAAPARQAADAIASLPGLFSPMRPATPIAFVFDDGVVHLLENHLKAEQDVVAQFLRQPSIDTLYRQSGRGAAENHASRLTA
jgi:hypothetical protein